MTSRDVINSIRSGLVRPKGGRWPRRVARLLSTFEQRKRRNCRKYWSRTAKFAELTGFGRPTLSIGHRHLVTHATTLAPSGRFGGYSQSAYREVGGRYSGWRTPSSVSRGRTVNQRQIISTCAMIAHNKCLRSFVGRSLGVARRLIIIIIIPANIIETSRAVTQLVTGRNLCKL